MKKSAKSLIMQNIIHQSQDTLSFETNGQGLYEVTKEVTDWIKKQDLGIGIFSLYCCHTSASLVIQENADPSVVSDLESFFKKLVPEELSRYRHISEGADDMPGHIKSALTQTTLTIPIRNGNLLLGTWQGIFLFEHRILPHTRRLVFHGIGSPK